MHSVSRKCIEASEKLVYDKPNHARPYFVVMTENCLNSEAQFRFVDNELLYNIYKSGTLVSPSEKTYNGSLAVYKGISREELNYEKSRKHRLKQTSAGSLFFYNISVCAEPSKTYVTRTEQCGTKEQEFTFGEWKLNLVENEIHGLIKLYKKELYGRNIIRECIYKHVHIYFRCMSR